MDRPWEKKVRSARELTYFDESNTGKWTGVVKLSVAAFNRIGKGVVKYSETSDRNRANVVIGVAEGQASFPFGGDDRPIVFSKTSTHGITRTFAYDTGIAKAVIFLPSDPSQDHRNVLQFITIHELVHACGLEAHDNDGVLMTAPNIRNGTIFSTPKSKKMPPFFMANKTTARLRAVW